MPHIIIIVNFSINVYTLVIAYMGRIFKITKLHLYEMLSFDCLH